MRALIVAALLLAAPVIHADPAQNLAEAVRFKTVSYQDRSRVDYDEFDRLLAFLRRTYPRVFNELDVELVNGYSLLLRWKGSDPAAAPILFTAHHDVVPVEPGTEGDWDFPAFSGAIDDGRIYGRGTLDDKVGVISLLEAAEALLEDGFRPRAEVVFAFGHDEEIGGQQGAKKLAERMQQLGLHFAWMVDEGGMVVSGTPLLPGAPLAMINVAEKGYLTLTLATQGEGGHSSNPPRTSSIGRLATAVAAVEQNPLPPRLTDPVKAMFSTLAPHLGQPERFVFNNLWLTGWLVAGRMADDRLTQPFVRTTTGLTMFNAGVKENVVPQRAEAKINFRLLPGDTQETVVQHVRELVDDPAVEISYDRWDGVPPVADFEGGGFEVIRQAVGEVYPDALATPSLLTATTDTRHYVELADNQYRFHGMHVQATQAASVHGTNEYIGIESFEKAIAVARRMIELGAR